MDDREMLNWVLTTIDATISDKKEEISYGAGKAFKSIADNISFHLIEVEYNDE